MSSYLKFDGVRDGLVAPSFAGVASTSWTVTAFVRIHSLPDQVCPIVQIYDGSTTTLAGIWLIPPAALATTRGQIFGVNWFETATEGRINNIAADVSGNPLRRGRIYKIQLMVDNASSKVSFGIDGVRVATASLSTPLGGTATYFALAGEFGKYNATTPLRAAHVDIIQAKFEVDRTLATSGGFPTIDADSAPFTDLTLDGSATSDSALYNLNAGTGSTVADDSGNGHTLDITSPSSYPDWAPTEADPKRPAPGVARWQFDTVEGYALRASDAPTVMPQPSFYDSVDRLGLARKAPVWWEDGERTAQWPVATQLTADTAQPFASRRSLKADGATGTTNSSDIPAGGITAKMWSLVGRFYDPLGTTGTRVQRFGSCSVLNALRVTLGNHQAQSTTHYVAFISGGTGGDHIATSIPLASGWHEFAIHGSDPGGGANGVIHMYVDGSLERSETAIVVSGYFARACIRQQGVSGSNDHGFYDEMASGLSDSGIDSEYGFLVETSGSAVLPSFQPAEGIAFFRSVTIDEETAGNNTEEVGSESLTFRHSIDGGSNWSSPAAFTTANLRARACAGNGQDVLEITVAQTAGMDNMGSPRLRSIEVDFEPAADVIELGEDAQLELASVED